jgi:hypothetical protein
MHHARSGVPIKCRHVALETDRGSEGNAVLGPTVLSPTVYCVPRSGRSGPRRIEFILNWRQASGLSEFKARPPSVL